MASATEQKTKKGLLPSGFKFLHFHDRVGKKTFDCLIIKMEDCLYVWIGDRNNPSMQDLSLAINFDFYKRTASRESITIRPYATKILGDVANATSLIMAKRLSRAFQKSIYVSFNITESYWIWVHVESRIRDEFETHMDLLDF